MFFQRFSCGNSTCTHTYIQRTSTCQSAQASSTRQTLFCLQDRRFFHETDSFNFMRRTFLFMRQTLFWQDRFFCFYETQLFCLVAARAGLLNHPVHHAAPCPENQHLLFVFLIFHAAGPPRLDVHAHVQKYMYACMQTYTCTHWLTLPRPSTARVQDNSASPTANSQHFIFQPCCNEAATRLKKKKQMHTCQKGPKLSGKSVY